MDGTIAITDHGWYEYLAGQPDLDEINSWTSSAHWTFRADVGAPFCFKLTVQFGHAILGSESFARFLRIPDWLAWDCFGPKNGCPTLQAMRERIAKIRDRIDYHTPRPAEEIGCILPVEPHFFRPTDWVVGPRDWPANILRPMKYDLGGGEGPRVWIETRRPLPADEPNPDQLRWHNDHVFLAA